MKRLTSLLFCLLIGIGMAHAQTKVTGTVISAENNEPVIGASIVVKGTTIGSVTDLDGFFSLEVPSSARTLMVSYLGLKTQEVQVKRNLQIVMYPDSKLLDEVMVVAYGTAKKESFTGSAEIIKSEKIAQRPVANVTKALEGLASGVQTTSGSGQPGSGVSVVIRGFGSINASQTPLYVVDGIPYDGNIVSINPNDIESMTILKDASAGALYGSRGANGVVMITTKKGNQGKIKVNLKANWGFASRSIPRYETMDEKGYVETVFQSYKNDLMLNSGLSYADAAVGALNNMKSGATAIFGKNEQYNPFNYSITELIDPTTGKVRSDATLKYSEDWMDEAMADSPLRQEYNVSLNGGSEKTKYMFSVGYLNEEGMLKTTNFERFNGRMNIDSEIAKWMKAGMNASFSRNESNTAVENSSGNSNVWYTAQLMAPIFPVFEKDATGATVMDALGEPVFDYGTNRPAGANADWNTIATLYDDKYSSASDNLSARMYATIGDLKEGPLEGLKLSVNYGIDLVNNAGMTYYNPYNGNSVAVKGTIDKYTTRKSSYTFNQILSYDREFGKHHVSAMVGHEFYKYNYQYLGATKTGFPFGGLFELDAATTISDASSYQDNYAVESILSRVEYDYDDKYYLSASYRTDGSSRFHEDNRWGHFWSVGGNWRISQEEFLKDKEWLNNLSVKASYGVQGNDNLGTYYAWQSFYDLGWPNASMSGVGLSSLENKDLKWEKNGNLNVGIEGRVFDRLSVSVEWYSRKTSDMLMSFPMASSLGFDGYNKNIGSMRNTGWDITLAGDIIKLQDFNWRLTLMGSTVKNKVLKLADKPEIISGSYIIKEGETLNSFYTANSAGVDPATGQQLYWAWEKDENGNQVGERYITNNQSEATKCKEIQGSRIPNLYGSFSNEFRWKDFDLNILCTYSIGGKVYDSVYRTLLYGNYIGQAKHAHLGRAWTQPGDITDIPRIEVGKSYIVTDADLINASYLAIKNITLGYSLPKKIAQSLKMQNVRFTATGDNLVLFNCLKGMDPQYNFTGGTNFGYVPVRTVSFGVDVTF
ncbi:MAG: TonB-dependent receptor [Parabacteroides distasonis]|nr:TonB-dependent receptor [Parabacteroides distasonis]